MNKKDINKLKKIYSSVSSYCETLEAINNKEQNKEILVDDDYDPIPELMETATNCMFKCLYALEEIINS